MYAATKAQDLKNGIPMQEQSSYALALAAHQHGMVSSLIRNHTQKLHELTCVSLMRNTIS